MKLEWMKFLKLSIIALQMKLRRNFFFPLFESSDFGEEWNGNVCVRRMIGIFEEDGSGMVLYLCA